MWFIVKVLKHYSMAALNIYTPKTEPKSHTDKEKGECGLVYSTSCVSYEKTQASWALSPSQNTLTAQQVKRTEQPEAEQRSVFFKDNLLWDTEAHIFSQFSSLKQPWTFPDLTLLII